mmetsp:Transcript_10074/g.39235  ORF Transcript_10074/g.39235 Transcript_10074/m.39235 type:complete len:257 (+) Transcript_10074:2665-3435(+)
MDAVARASFATPSGPPFSGRAADAPTGTATRPVTPAEPRNEEAREPRSVPLSAAPAAATAGAKAAAAAPAAPAPLPAGPVPSLALVSASVLPAASATDPRAVAGTAGAAAPPVQRDTASRWKESGCLMASSSTSMRSWFRERCACCRADVPTLVVAVAAAAAPAGSALTMSSTRQASPTSTAAWRGLLRRSEGMWGDAPAWSRVAAMSACPPSTAESNAVFPLSLRRSSAAPALTSAATLLPAPRSAARIRGVFSP